MRACSTAWRRLLARSPFVLHELENMEITSSLHSIYAKTSTCPMQGEMFLSVQMRVARLYERRTESGQWQLDDEAYAALRGALSAYVAQLHIISADDLQRAQLLRDV